VDFNLLRQIGHGLASPDANSLCCAVFRTGPP
jgi:hypothetical protein